jgi:hypothetical protein
MTVAAGHARWRESFARDRAGGAADTMISLTKEDCSMVIKCAKQKDAAPFGDIGLRLVPIGESCVLEPDSEASRGGGLPGHARTALRVLFNLTA